MGNHSTLSLGVSPDIFFNFERFCGRFNGFQCVRNLIAVALGHVFCQKRSSLWSETECKTKSFLDSYDFHFFRQHVTLSYVSAGFCQDF